MDPVGSTQDSWTWLGILLAIAAVLAILAAANLLAARLAERRNPPRGAFLEVDGVKLHYRDRGSGPPVVLIHGNAVTGDDYDTSGVAERLLGTNRVLIFDRPGFGHTDRPRGRPWTATEQAELLHQALLRLGVARPVVVGHSWGTLVALALAVRHPREVAGLVLLSGYYFPTFRLDALMVAPGATPVLGDILRYTISPIFGWLTMPLTKRVMFSPSAPTARFQAEYSTALAMRPSQIRAMCMDGTLMVQGASELSPHYGALSLPVAIIAGDGDKIVSHRLAERLHGAIPGSSLEIVPGTGHMVHHVAPEPVVMAIRSVAGRAGGVAETGAAAQGRMSGASPAAGINAATGATPSA